MTRKKASTKKPHPDPIGVDVKHLIAEVLSTTSGFRTCPFSQLEGQAKEFFDAMLYAEHEGNRKVPRHKVRQVLREAFGLSVGDDAIRKHLRKDCAQCHPARNLQVKKS
jgi:hypothetical protein